LNIHANGNSCDKPGADKSLLSIFETAAPSLHENVKCNSWTIFLKLLDAVSSKTVGAGRPSPSVNNVLEDIHRHCILRNAQFRECDNHGKKMRGSDMTKKRGIQSPKN
jgi:hypothetical protein